MARRQDHPSHLFPSHGSQVFQEIVGWPPGVLVRSEPPDLDARVEADKSAVWIPHEEAAMPVLSKTQHGERLEVPDSDKIVQFEPAQGVVTPEQIERARYWCWVCGYGFEYSRLASG